MADYDQALRRELTGSIALRLQRLDRIAEGNAEVIEMIRYRLESIALIEADGGPTTDIVIAGSQTSEPVPIDLRYALHDGSVADLVGVVRRWREGVESYPATYTKLNEEDISSLFVTTLNTVFDTAQREVFRSAGKTDIFVQANIGDYNEAAHIAEAKIWRGQAEVAADIAQLLGYANARTSSQLLLYYVRELGLTLVADRCRKAVATGSIDGEIEELERYDFATTVSHPTFGSEIRITVMFVHLPDVGTAEPSAAADQSTTN